MAQMKGQNRTPEKELNKMEITNLSDEEFETLVVRMLRELIEYGTSIREEMKVTLSKIKKNPQGTTVNGRKLGFKLTICNMREK